MTVDTKKLEQFLGQFVNLVLIVNAEPARELDLITSLPVWPRMETAVVPLTTFEGRAESLRAEAGAAKRNNCGELVSV
jgi:hypothetical protein